MGSRCKSRGQTPDGRKRCDLESGHNGWHGVTLPSGSRLTWDAKGGWKFERGARPEGRAS